MGMTVYTVRNTSHWVIIEGDLYWRQRDQDNLLESDERVCHRECSLGCLRAWVEEDMGLRRGASLAGCGRETLNHY